MVIVADSAIQLSLEYLSGLGVAVVDYPTFMNGSPYPVSMEMSEEEKEALRLLLKDKNNSFTTAGLRAEDLLAAYRKFPGEKIISLHQSSKATTVTADTIRRVLSENPGLDVQYVDSTFLTSAYSVIVKQAAMAARNGLPREKVLEVIETAKKNTRHLGVIYDLFYLHHTGRIGLAKAVLGTAMKIINILSSAEEPGNLKSIGKVRNFHQANERFISIVREDMAARGGKSLTGVISVVGPHREEAEHLAGLVEGLGIGAEVQICGTNHSNMPHVGPDFYDFGYTVTR